MQNLTFRRIAPLLLLSASLAVPAVYAAVGAAQETTASVLAKMTKASIVPGVKEADGDQRTIYTITAGGLTGSIQEVHAKPNKTRTELTLGPLRQITTDNGVTRWQQDSTGNVRIIRGAELAEAREASSLTSSDPVKNAAKGKFTLEREREAGTGAFVIDVMSKSGASQKLYVDPKTYLPSKIVTPSGTQIIRAYQTVGGRRIASVLDISYATSPLTIHMELKSSEHLAKADPALFETPESAKDYEFLAGSKGKSAEIPFTFDKGVIVIDASINGHPVRMMVDSGAGSSVIAGAAADASGLTPEGDLATPGYGGSSASGLASKAVIEIPGLVRIKDQIFSVIKDPTIAQGLSEHGQVDGILGYNLFARFRVRVDYDRKVLTFTDFSVPPASAAHAIAWPIRLIHQTPAAFATIDGKHTGRFLVDSGDTGSVNLYTKFARQNSMMFTADTPGAKVIPGFGVGGPVSVILTAGHSLTINKVKIKNVSLSNISGAGVSSTSELAGGIGNNLLRHFIVTFDYSNMTILLEPNSSDVAMEEKTAGAHSPLDSAAPRAHSGGSVN